MSVPISKLKLCGRGRLKRTAVPNATPPARFQIRFPAGAPTAHARSDADLCLGWENPKSMIVESESPPSVEHAMQSVLRHLHRKHPEANRSANDSGSNGSKE